MLIIGLLLEIASFERGGYENLLDKGEKLMKYKKMKMQNYINFIIDQIFLLEISKFPGNKYMGEGIIVENRKGISWIFINFVSDDGVFSVALIQLQLS